MYIFDVSTLVSCVPARVKDQCNFPLVWEDIWINPKQGTKVRNNILAFCLTTDFFDDLIT